MDQHSRRPLRIEPRELPPQPSAWTRLYATRHRTTASYRALNRLWRVLREEGTQPSVRHLARRLRQEPSTTLRLLRRLEDLGCLVSDDEGDLVAVWPPAAR